MMREILSTLECLEKEQNPYPKDVFVSDVYDLARVGWSAAFHTMKNELLRQLNEKIEED